MVFLHILLSAFCSGQLLLTLLTSSLSPNLLLFLVMILSVIVDLDAILLPGVHPPILPFLHSHLPSSNHQELFLNPKSSFQSAHPDSPLAYPMIITSPCSRQFRETKIPSLCHPTKVIDESSWYKGRVSILSRTATAIRILFLPLLQIP